MPKYLHRYGYRWLLFNSKNDIVNLDNYNGTYIIRIKADTSRFWKIIYVGETRNIRVRITTHAVLNIVRKQLISYGRTDKTQILFYPMEGLSRKRFENWLIGKFTPMYNYIEKCRRTGKSYLTNHTHENEYKWLKFFRH